jgi:uncharacterized membrane protein
MNFDLQDCLLIVGILFFVGGIAAFSFAAAAIVFGLLCFVGVALMARGGSSSDRTHNRKGRA